MKEIADFLKSERLERDLTLRSVSERSGVSIDMLDLFERCDLERLGSALLVRYIIRGYCGALEIDPQPVLDKAAPDLDNLNFQELGIKKYAVQVKLLRKKRRRMNASLLLFAVATAAVLYAGTWISEQRARLYAPVPAERILSQEELPPELVQKLATAEPQHNDSETPAAAPGNEPLAKVGADTREADRAIMQAEKNLQETTETAGKAEEPAEPLAQEDTGEMTAEAQPSPDMPRVAISNSMEAVAEDKPAEPVPEPKSYVFAVEADAKTWVQVRIDDRHIRSAMLYPGDKREWSARKGMQVVIGNAGGVSMKWDEQPINAPREAGRVLRFKLPDQIASIGD